MVYVLVYSKLSIDRDIVQNYIQGKLSSNDLISVEITLRELNV